MNEISPVRVRFAPSPTGYLHVGGLRTALYNFLFARKHKGTFVLRIEDTDRSRYVEHAVENLIEMLHWAGFDYDEGPVKGGPYGPYIQSERLDIYKKHIDHLLMAGQAYRCFCTPDRLEEVRREQAKNRINPKYDRHCLKLPQREVGRRVRGGVPFVVRMKVPDEKAVRFRDLIRGDVEFASEQMDDQVLIKSDGYPTYHFANVVDDHLMRISHVIRGEEWLSSTPKHVLLYRFFGWETPTFAHLPLLFNPDRSKLSKRQGDVAVEDFRAKGYLKGALVNFVALLGWNPGTEQEFFSLEELIQHFSLEQVNKSGANFDLDKLKWLNFEYLRRTPDDQVLQMFREELARSKYKETSFDDAYLRKVIQAMRVRVSFVRDFLSESPYFFECPAMYDEATVKKRWSKGIPAQLKILVEEFMKLQNPLKQDFESALHATAAKLQGTSSDLIHAVRLAVTGVGGGPGLYDILEIIGRDECVQRILKAIDTIKTNETNDK